MMADYPRTRTSRRAKQLLGLLAFLALAGCRSDGSKGSGSRDPLVYGPNRIPPQNVPLSDRSGVGVGARAPKPTRCSSTGREEWRPERRRL